jgi:hypothetical protein
VEEAEAPEATHVVEEPVPPTEDEEKAAAPVPVVAEEEKEKPAIEPAVVPDRIEPPKLLKDTPPTAPTEVVMEEKPTETEEPAPVVEEVVMAEKPIEEPADVHLTVPVVVEEVVMEEKPIEEPADVHVPVPVVVEEVVEKPSEDLHLPALQARPPAPSLLRSVGDEHARVPYGGQGNRFDTTFVPEERKEKPTEESVKAHVPVDVEEIETPLDDVAPQAAPPTGFAVPTEQAVIGKVHPRDESGPVEEERPPKTARVETSTDVRHLA